MNARERKLVAAVAEVERLAIDETDWLARLRAERAFRDAAREVAGLPAEEMRDLIALGRRIGAWRSEVAA